jgi:hypothetical protein
VSPTSSPQSGFSLLELLVSALVTTLVIGAVLAVLGPARWIARAQPAASDEQQRLRVAVDALGQELLMAGAGTYMGPAGGALNRFVAPILPYRAFGPSADSPGGVYFRPDAVSFLYVPSTASQATLADVLPPGALDIRLAPAPNCPAPASAEICGFRSGDSLVLFDGGGNWDVFRIDQVSDVTAILAHRGPGSLAGFDRGASVSEVRIGTFYLKAETSQLMRYDGWGSDLPVVDEVVRLEFQYFGDAEPPRLIEPYAEESLPQATYGPSPPPVGTRRGYWPEGENCAFLVVDGVHQPRLPALGPGGVSLVELTDAMLTDGPWCPDPTAPNRFDADLLRVRRVRFVLRVQSALPSLRGALGGLFLKGGFAREGAAFVPDLEVRADIAPRNLNLGR